MLTFVADEAVVVVPLVLARPPLEGASGFVQLIRRWKTGKRRNIPPGAGSREITAQRGIPVRARLYAVCSPPGPLPTSTTS
jgi:hypothetical protein